MRIQSMQLINSVYILNSTQYRILKFLPQYTIWIAIDNKHAFADLFLSKELQTLSDDQSLIPAQDPYEYLKRLNLSEDSIQLKKRDENFLIIQDLINDEQVLINTKIRTAKIKTLHLEKEVSINKILRLLRRYWQRGQTINALVPDYENSGGKGQKRAIGDKKIGRPRIYESNGGKNVTEQVELYFKKAIEEYLVPVKKQSINETYLRFKSVFSKHFHQVQTSDIPTYAQFYYFYNTQKEEYYNLLQVQEYFLE